MQLHRYAPILVLMSLLGGCGDNSQKEQADATAVTGTESAAPAADMVTGTTSRDVGDPIDAAALYAASCASCHGASGEGVGDFPGLASLSRDVVQSRLEAYRIGETVGPRSTIMAPLAGQLSNEQIAALASYLGS